MLFSVCPDPPVGSPVVVLNYPTVQRYPKAEVFSEPFDRYPVKIWRPVPLEKPFQYIFSERFLTLVENNIPV